jgi:hypothetical protein
MSLTFINFELSAVHAVIYVRDTSMSLVKSHSELSLVTLSKFNALYRPPVTQL